jgi:Tissue inhibitor of metalloproteinase
MKKIIWLVCSIVLIGFLGRAAYGCSCREVAPDKKQGINYKKWLKNFNGAVFVGQVVKIEEAEARNQLKVTFKVERHWKGVKTTEAIIYTGLNDAACGVTYSEGKKYFVVADLYEGKLHTNLCSWLGYSKNEKAYLKGLGKGKSPRT